MRTYCQNAQTDIRPQLRQRGAVLFLAMIFLVLLTILAITASSTSIMQERMTGGMRNRQLALIGAENALRGGEELLWNLSFDFQQPLPPCIASSIPDCVYIAGVDGALHPKVQAFRTTQTWLPAATDGARPYPRNLTTLSGDDISANLAAQPRYMIEYLGLAGPTLAGGEGFIGRTGGAVYAEGGTSRVGEHHLYRITARSQGGTDAVVRILESTFVSMNLTNSNFNPDATP